MTTMPQQPLTPEELLRQQMLGTLFGSVAPQEPHRTPLPATTFPEAPRSINPQMSQMIMQMMMGAQDAPSMPSLGALLGGKV